MLIAKEMNGGIYVAQLGKTYGPDSAGPLPSWFFIGPGLRPTVVNYGTGVYMVLFDYMGVLNARLLQNSTWPPTQVDPVTYTPFISVQRSEDAVAFSVFGSSPYGRRMPDIMGPANGMTRTADLLYDADTNTYSTAISRISGFNPDPVTLRGWRLYSKPMGAPEDQWAVALDWQTELTDIPITGSPKIQVDYAVTWGHLFDPDRPNDPVARLESPKGVVFTLNSDLISKTLRTSYSETSRATHTEGEDTGAFAYMYPKQMFFNTANGSGVDIPRDSEGVSTFGGGDTMGGSYSRGVFFAVPFVASTGRVTLVEGSRTGSFGRVEDRWMPIP